MNDIFWIEGLPAVWLVPLLVAVAIVVTMFAWSVSLYVRAGRWRPDPPAEAPGADRFLWIFLVPALNEAVTIADSVRRLLEVEVEHRQIVVIDDGSDDETPAVLAGISHPDLRVIRRDPPDARRGKAAALNHAYSNLNVAPWPREQVVVAIVDADGRLAADAPQHIAAHFADPTVGGVQSLVRIYNRSRLLAWFQDLEFGVYGHLFQAGRNRAGTAGMGGNGQFNRLSALDDVVDAEAGGPWRHRLTEDQDLGLRLIARGWRGHQDLRATVDQQGLSQLRPLLRQRTRWAQGNLQALDLMAPVARARLPLASRLEQVFQLCVPFMQGLIGVALMLAVFLAATGRAPLWGDGPTWHLLVIYLLGFGGTVLGCIAARRDQGVRGHLIGFLLGHAYAFYAWLLWPALARAAVRQLGRRREWAKTQREPLSDGAPAGPLSRPS